MEPTLRVRNSAEAVDGESTKTEERPFTAPWLPAIPLDADDRLAAYARWFIRLRWIATLVALELVVVGVQVGKLLPQIVWAPLVATLGLLVAVNLFYTMQLRLRRTRVFDLAFQAYADLLILVTLLHFSGGVENPLAMIMVFHVIIAGIILHQKHCYAIAVAGTTLFAIMGALELFGIVGHYGLGIFPHNRGATGVEVHAAHDILYAGGVVSTHGIVLMLTAFFVTWLSERLQRRERQLEVVTEQAVGERQLLEQALETTGTGLCVCDEDLRPLMTNGRWENWLGDCLHDPSIANQILGAESPVRRTLRDGCVRVTELAAPALCDPRDGRRIYQVTAAPLAVPDSSAMRVVQLVQDITEQKAIQARMVRAGQLAAVGELAGQVAHEVNNPIAIITAKARLLLSDHQDEISERAASELEKIAHLGDRVALIARKLLAYARPSSGNRSTIDVSDPVRYALAVIEEPASRCGITIDDRLPRSAAHVVGCREELEQVFLNLLLNALDAMPQGGTLTVSAAIVADGRFVRIRVTDTGKGIPEDILRHVFEPFFTTKPDSSGTGLGLPICMGFVRSHGGSMGIESTSGGGTTVTVSLPAALKIS